jgi:hypothetical protein
MVLEEKNLYIARRSCKAYESEGRVTCVCMYIIQNLISMKGLFLNYIKIFTLYLKRLSHEMDLAFDDMYGFF